MAIHRLGELSSAQESGRRADARGARHPSRSSSAHPTVRAAPDGAGRRQRDRRLARDAGAGHDRRQPDERLPGDGERGGRCSASTRWRGCAAPRDRGALAIDELLAGPGRTTADPGELLEADRDRRSRPPARAAATCALEYRRHMEIAVVGATAVLTLKAGRCSRCADRRSPLSRRRSAASPKRRRRCSAVDGGSAGRDRRRGSEIAAASDADQRPARIRSPTATAMAAVIGRRAIEVARRPRPRRACSDSGQPGTAWRSREYEGRRHAPRQRRSHARSRSTRTRACCEPFVSRSV